MRQLIQVQGQTKVNEMKKKKMPSDSQVIHLITSTAPSQGKNSIREFSKDSTSCIVSAFSATRCKLNPSLRATWPMVNLISCLLFAWTQICNQLTKFSQVGRLGRTRTTVPDKYSLHAKMPTIPGKYRLAFDLRRRPSQAKQQQQGWDSGHTCAGNRVPEFKQGCHGRVPQKFSCNLLFCVSCVLLESVAKSEGFSQFPNSLLLFLRIFLHHMFLDRSMCPFHFLVAPKWALGNVFEEKYHQVISEGLQFL